MHGHLTVDAIKVVSIAEISQFLPTLWKKQLCYKLETFCGFMVYCNYQLSKIRHYAIVFVSLTSCTAKLTRSQLTLTEEYLD